MLLVLGGTRTANEGDASSLGIDKNRCLPESRRFSGWQASRRLLDDTPKLGLAVP